MPQCLSADWVNGWNATRLWTLHNTGAAGKWGTARTHTSGCGNRLRDWVMKTSETPDRKASRRQLVGSRERGLVPKTCASAVVRGPAGDTWAVKALPGGPGRKRGTRNWKVEGKRQKPQLGGSCSRVGEGPCRSQRTMTSGHSLQERGLQGGSRGAREKGQRSEHPVTRGLFEERRRVPSPEVRFLNASLLMTWLGDRRPTWF